MTQTNSSLGYFNLSIVRSAREILASHLLLCVVNKDFVLFLGYCFGVVENRKEEVLLETNFSLTALQPITSQTTDITMSRVF